MILSRELVVESSDVLYIKVVVADAIVTLGTKNYLSFARTKSHLKYSAFDI